MGKLNIKHQLSNGTWSDCEGREAEFITMCAEFGEIGESDVIDALKSGRELYYRAEWYASCKIAPKKKAVVAEKVETENDKNLQLLADTGYDWYDQAV